MKKCWLNGKTVIISGASGGLGFNIAKSLIEKFDCKIIGIARNETKLKANIETLRDKKDNFSYYLFDVSIKENWINFKNTLEEKNIIPDVLINNAGFMLSFSKFENYTEDEINEIINTNFISYVNSTRILLPLLKKSKTPAILNIASAAGLCAVVGQSMYCATKFAVKGFTETLQQDYKKQIFVGGIYPGFIRTDILNRQKTDDKTNKLIQKLMKPVGKATKIIVKGLKKKKKRVVMGVDGHLMSFFSRIFPVFTPNVITKVLKASKLQLFDGVFSQGEVK